MFGSVSITNTTFSAARAIGNVPSGGGRLQKNPPHAWAGRALPIAITAITAHSLASIAEALKTLGDTDTLAHRRAKAIGIIADPVYTEELLRQAQAERRGDHVDVEAVIRGFITQLPRQFEVAQDNVVLQGAIVDIDDKSLEKLGQWPWPRTRIAALVTELTRLGGLLAALASEDCPFDPAPPRPVSRVAHWVDPELVAEVTFGEWTHDDIIRHASYIATREDKDPHDVVRES